MTAGLGMLALSSVLGQAATQFFPGLVLREYYLNIGGGAIADLRNSGKYPNNPDQSDFATSVEAITGFGDNYGIRISGVLIPPADGEYTFWVSGDDNCEVWLSTDEKPANITRIAREPEWNDARQWVVTDRRNAANPENRSASISLTGGKQYYFEALMKEGGGGDSLGVTALPTGNSPANGDASTLTDAIIGVYADDTPRVGATVSSAVPLADKPIILSAPTPYAPPGTPSYQWYRNNAPIGGATDKTYAFTPTAADNGASYALEVTVEGKSAKGSPLVLNLDVEVDSKGFAKVEIFTGINGTAVANLTAAQKYLDNAPDQVFYVPGFEYNGNQDNYGGRMSGTFVAPEDGNYVFYIAADDGAELFISSDEDPANLQSVATQPAWSNFREWLTNQGGGAQAPSKVSAPISLVKGGRYLVQGLWKEGGGGDNFAATYGFDGEAGPANGTPSKISGVSLLNKVPQNGVALTIDTQPVSQTIPQGRNGSLSVAAKASNNSTASLPISYQWQKNTGAGYEDIAGATGSKLDLPFQSLADNGTKYRVLLYTLGAEKASSEVTITVVPDTFPPTVVSAGAMKHFNTDGIEIQVIFNEPLDQASATTLANYTLSSGTVTGARYVSNPSGINNLERGVILTTSGLSAGASVNLSIKNVADALGNKITTAVVTPVKVSALNWASIGRVLGPNQDENDLLQPAAFNVAGDSDFNLVSGGMAFWGSNDDITIAYEEVTGDFDKSLRVEYSDPSSNWARSGLSARESLNEGRATTGPDGDNPASRYQMVLADPTTKFDGTAANNQFETNRRLVAGGDTSSSNAGGTPAYPNAWVRLKRVNGWISMYYGTDGSYWRPLGSTDFRASDPALSDTLFVGPTFGPENGNIGDASLRREWATRIRQYGNTAGNNKPVGQQTYSIGLNVGASEAGGQLSPNDVAGVNLVAQKHWNNLFQATGPTPDPNATVPGVIVADNGGTAEDTTVNVDIVSNNLWASHGPRGEQNSLMTGADGVLMTGYLDTGDNTTSQVKISGLPAKLTDGGYDVYVYFLGGVGQGRGGAYRVTDDQGNELKGYILADCSDNPTGFVQVTEEPGSTAVGVGNWLVFRGLNNPNIIIEATTASIPDVGDPGIRAPINAVQIVTPSGIGGGGKPTISISASGSITFTGKLFQADKVDGPYTEVTGATSPFTPPANSVKFYRSSN